MLNDHLSTSCFLWDNLTFLRLVLRLAVDSLVVDLYIEVVSIYCSKKFLGPLSIVKFSKNKNLVANRLVGICGTVMRCLGL